VYGVVWVSGLLMSTKVPHGVAGVMAVSQKSVFGNQRGARFGFCPSTTQLIQIIIKL
jgi:hypothetical protein